MNIPNKLKKFEEYLRSTERPSVEITFKHGTGSAYGKYHLYCLELHHYKSCRISRISTIKPQNKNIFKSEIAFLKDIFVEFAVKPD